MARRSNNEGSITKRPNGRWRAQVSIDGNRISHNGITKAECQRWLRKMLDQIEQGLTYAGSQTTLEDFFSNWVVTVQTSLRPKTAHQYEKIINNYIIPGVGKLRVKDLRPETVDAFYQKQLRAEVGVRTVRYIHSVLHVGLEKAVKLGLVGRNPVDGATPPRLNNNEMLVLDETQVTQFLLGAQENRNKALFHLAVKTGMRQGELLGLKWVDLDWVSGYLQVRRQVQRIDGKGFVFCEPKTKAGRRTIQLGETMLQTLREHIRDQRLEKMAAGVRWKENDLIFPSTIGTPLDLRNLLRDFKEILEKAGLPEIRFHDLRHSAASIMLKHNIPVLTVSRILGHSKPSVTLDIYGHLIPGMQSFAAKVMDEVIMPMQVSLPNPPEDLQHATVRREVQVGK
jgi:integrase